MLTRGSSAARQQVRSSHFCLPSAWDKRLTYCIYPNTEATNSITSPGLQVTRKKRLPSPLSPFGNYSVNLNTICKQFPTVPCPRETRDNRWARKTAVRSTAGQHFKCNKAVTMECWQWQTENKKILFFFLIVMRTAIWLLSEGTWCVFRCRGCLKHLHWASSGSLS